MCLPYDQEDDEDVIEELVEDSDGCPVCGSYNLIKEGRCTTCMECGWSKCSI